MTANGKPAGAITNAHKSPVVKKHGNSLSVLHPSEQRGALAIVGGSQSDDFNNTLANQVLKTLWRPEGLDQEQCDLQNVAAITALIGAKPTSELEGMLAAQMVAIHNAAMECFRRAMLPKQPAQFQTQLLAQGIKATRAYAALLEALDRHRGKGSEQRVTVEHVHVHQGGQAIVGTVTTRGREAATETGRPAHAHSEG